MTVVLLVAAGALAVVVLTPLELRLASTGGRGVSLTFRVGGLRVMRKGVGGAGPRREESTGRSPLSSVRRLSAIVRRARPLLGPAVGQPGRRWLVRSLHSVDLSAADAVLEFGLRDPAETGRLFGVSSALARGLGGRLQLVPDFSGPRVRLSGEFGMRSNIARLSWPSIAFCVEPAVLAAAWRVLTFRKAAEPAVS